ncbi:MAG: hypothetical protein ACJASL_003851 [Paraglaciecola sp.]
MIKLPYLLVALAPFGGILIALIRVTFANIRDIIDQAMVATSTKMAICL